MEKLYYINCINCGRLLYKSHTVGKSVILVKCSRCKKKIKIQQEDSRIILEEVDDK